MLVNLNNLLERLGFKEVRRNTTFTKEWTYYYNLDLYITYSDEKNKINIHGILRTTKFGDNHTVYLTKKYSLDKTLPSKELFKTLLKEILENIENEIKKLF